MTYFRKININPYKDRGPTDNQSGDVIKIITQTYKVINATCISKINKDIRQRRLRSARLEPNSGQQTK